MEKWQTGDMTAFEAFFRENERAVFRNAYLITGSREDAEDVLQDVFTSVWKSRHTYDANKGKLSTWLHRITVNECLRKRHKDRPLMLRVDPEELAGQAQERPDKLDFEALTEAMSALDPKHRAVLVLRYFNDLSYDEIAGTLQVPLGTVKSRINHAIRSLRNRLGESDDRS
jgi:RNA polymerase sigma-70 factor (ECF subfamily)